MEKEEPGFDTFKVHLKDYVNTRIDLAVLKAADKGSNAVSNVALYSMVFFIGLFFLFLLSVAVSLIISDAIGNIWSGFMIMAGFYMLAGFLLWIMRDKWVRKPIVNSIIRSLFGERREPWIK